MKKQLLLLAALCSMSSSIFSQIISTLAGTSTAGYFNGTGSAALFNNPTGFTSVGGIFYVADRNNHCIRAITPAGVVTTLAGSGSGGFVNATGTAASFSLPVSVTADPFGNIYVADSYNHVIRKVTSAGVVTTLAGSGTAGFADATGTAAQFNVPSGVIFYNGFVYVSDKNNNRIRKVSVSTGAVTTLAGTGATGMTNGNGATATFNSPAGVGILSSNGFLLVADEGNHAIRIVDTFSNVTTLAGTGAPGATDGTVTAASFNGPTGVTCDAQANVYVADQGNSKIRILTATTGMVSTYAGSAGAGFQDGLANVARFNHPSELRFLGGSIYVTDKANNRIRKIDPCTTPNFPTDASTDHTVCVGASATLAATGTSTICWYSSATATTPVSTGSVYVASNTLAIGAYTMFAADSNVCTAGPRLPIEFTVVCCSGSSQPSNATPAANTTVCAGNTTTLTATASGTINWYASASGGSPLVTGASCIVQNTLAAGAYTYYAEAATTCTVSARTPVMFTVSCCGIPAAPLNVTPVNNATVCSGSSGTLIASGNGSINWYATATGGSAISTGTNYITPAILPVGVYTVYAETATSCSVSATRTPFTFSVVVCCFAPAPPQNTTPAANTTVCVGSPAILTATSTGTVSWFNGSTGGTAISTGTLYTTSNALPAGSYVYYAEAASSCSVSASRTPVSFTVVECGTPTGLNSKQAELIKATIYPNPTHGLFTLETNTNETKTIEVVELTGRVLFSKITSDARTQFDLEAFDAGIYFLKIQSAGSIHVLKVTKQ